MKKSEVGKRELRREMRKEKREKILVQNNQITKITNNPVNKPETFLIHLIITNNCTCY